MNLAWNQLNTILGHCIEFHLFDGSEHPNNYLNHSQCEFCHEYVQFVMYVVMTDGWLEHT